MKVSQLKHDQKHQKTAQPSDEQFLDANLAELGRAPVKIKFFTRIPGRKFYLIAK